MRLPWKHRRVRHRKKPHQQEVAQLILRLSNSFRCSWRSKARSHDLSAAPTFIPQTFQDQIQFVFDGTNYHLYLYFNNQWNNFSASGGGGGSGVIQLIAGFGISLSPSGGTGTVTVACTITDATLPMSDITTNNVSASQHGFVPKLPNDATKVLNGLGAWVLPPGGGSAGFDYGDGSDGSTTISGTTTLTRDMFYTTLTVANGGLLKPNGFRVFASTSIEVQSGGTISTNGGAGGTGVAGSNTTGSGQRGTGGSGGAGGTAIPNGTLKTPGNGQAGTNGGNGDANTSANQLNGVAGSNETNGITSNSGVAGGNSGTGCGNSGGGGSQNSSMGGTAGTITQVTKPSSIEIIASMLGALGGYGCSAGSGSGAGGGGGFGISSNDSLGGGGGGGGAGAAGGILWLASPIVTVDSGGVMQSNGGNGGNGGVGGNATGAGSGGQSNGGGGGGGGGGGNGGLIIVISPAYTNNGSVTVSGGNAGSGAAHGTGGAGNIAPTNGSNGTAGNNGAIINMA